MNEFIKKLIGRLEEHRSLCKNTNIPCDMVVESCITIVNELAEEYSHCTLCYLQGPCEYQNENVQMPMEYWERDWIPTSERLPDNEDYVLCWYEYYRFGSYNRMYQTYGLGYYIKQYDMWGGEVNQGQKCRVIAWHPLPAPYNPKGE